jgi:hypothetical protein
MILLRQSAFILILVFTFSFSVSNAQDKKPKKTLKEKSIAMAVKLNKEVKLTKDQLIKVKAINDVYLKQKQTLSKELKQLKKEYKTKIEALLTEEQKQKKETLKKKKNKKEKEKKIDKKK